MGTFGLVRFNQDRLNIGINSLAVQVNHTNWIYLKRLLLHVKYNRIMLYGLFFFFLCIDVLKIFLPYEKMRKLIFILFYGNSISHHHRLSKQVRTVRLLDPLQAPPRRSSIPCRRGRSAGTSGRSPVPRKSRAPLPSPRRAPRCCY